MAAPVAIPAPIVDDAFELQPALYQLNLSPMPTAQSTVSPCESSNQSSSPVVFHSSSCVVANAAPGSNPTHLSLQVASGGQMAKHELSVSSAEMSSSPLPLSPQSIHSSLNEGPQSPTQVPWSYLESMRFMARGGEFVKYNATKRNPLVSVFSSASSKRFLFYEKEKGSLGALYWCKVGERNKVSSRSIPLSHVRGLYERTQTDCFERVKDKLTEEEKYRCFSVVCGEFKNEQGQVIPARTLDLLAPTYEIRNTWMHCIHQILVLNGYKMKEEAGLANARIRAKVTEALNVVGMQTRKSSATLNASTAEASQTSASRGAVGFSRELAAAPDSTRNQVLRSPLATMKEKPPRDLKSPVSGFEKKGPVNPHELVSPIHITTAEEEKSQRSQAVAKQTTTSSSVAVKEGYVKTFEQQTKILKQAEAAAMQQQHPLKVSVEDEEDFKMKEKMKLPEATKIDPTLETKPHENSPSNPVVTMSL